MSNPILEAALNYRFHNISVIPVGKNKIPLIPWKDFQTRLATPEEISKWFTDLKDAQLGIVTGKISNLTVVDIEAGGDPSFLPQNTSIIKTGGGGWHYYYLYEPGVANSARIRDLVDIRGEGGYVVAPPSSSDKGLYSLVKSESCSKFPGHLFGLKDAVKSKQATNTVSSDEYPGYGEGRRNDEMTRYIGSVLTRIHPSDWEKLAWTIIASANQKNTPPLSDFELRNSFRSIMETEKRKSPDRWNKKSNNTNTPQAWESETEDDIVLMSEVAEAQSIKIDDINPLGYPIFDEAILGGSVPGDLIIVSAPTGEGKTSFCQSLTVNFLNDNKKVLWFSYEVLMSYLWQKFQKMQVKSDSFIFAPFKHTTGNVGWIEKKVKEAKTKFGVKVVVIDHLGFLMPKMKQDDISRNYAAYLTQVVREIKTLAVQEEIIIILPVHMRKTEKPDINDIRDASGIAQEADLVFIMERIKNEGDAAGTAYYSEYTKISLVKNRKTGKSVVGKFHMISEKFTYDENETMKKAASGAERGRGSNNVFRGAVKKEIPKYNEDGTPNIMHPEFGKEEVDVDKTINNAMENNKMNI